LQAYEGVVAERGLKSVDQREAAAKLVIALAQKHSDLDPEKLRPWLTC
jgi:hypothetical protein